METTLRIKIRTKNPKNKEEEPKEQKQIKCKYCRATLKRIRDLNSHLNNKHKEDQTVAAVRNKEVVKKKKGQQH